MPPGGVVAGVVGIERALFMTVSMANGPLFPCGTMFPLQNEESGPPPITLDALEGGVGKDMLLCISGRG